MVNIKKNILGNLLLLIIGYIIPIIILKLNQNNYEHIFIIQIVALSVILVCGFLLMFINNKNRKIQSGLKTWFIIFQFLGLVGILYSLYPLYLILAFRNGIGF